MTKQVDKFLACLLKLEPIELIGMARILKVDILPRGDEQNPHNAATATLSESEIAIIISEILDAYIKCNKQQRKAFLKIVKDATLEVDEHGTQNTAK